MCKYIKLCRQPQKPKLTIARHLVDESQINAYSIKELMDLASLRRELIAFQAQLFEHITKHCEVRVFVMVNRIYLLHCFNITFFKIYF